MAGRPTVLKAISQRSSFFLVNKNAKAVYLLMLGGNSTSSSVETLADGCPDMVSRLSRARTFEVGSRFPAPGSQAERLRHDTVPE
jgi:hypothetical protein